MKYSKPIIMRLGEDMKGSAECNFGSFPGEQCGTGFTNVGPCQTGFTAGQTCASGTTPSGHSTCSQGINASACTNGSWAGLQSGSGAAGKGATTINPLSNHIIEIDKRR